jgi:hypothetical protein
VKAGRVRSYPEGTGCDVAVGFGRILVVVRQTEAMTTPENALAPGDQAGTLDGTGVRVQVARLQADGTCL